MGKDASMGFRTFGIEAALNGPFLGHLIGVLESTGAAHTQGYLAREIPGSYLQSIRLWDTSSA